MSTSGAAPIELLAVARSICEKSPQGLAGRWQRAVALITRVALEEALDDFWRTRSPGMERCGGQRAKMLCLPSYFPDAEMAHDVYETWASLSAACHSHAYGLEPTADELLRWIDRVAAMKLASVSVP